MAPEAFGMTPLPQRIAEQNADPPENVIGRQLRAEWESKASELGKAVEKIRGELRQDIVRARAREDLSSEGKRKLVAHHYETSMKKYEKAKADDAAAKAKRRKDLEASLFGPGLPSHLVESERHTRLMGWRDAQERAEAAFEKGEDHLLSLLERAELSGDNQMAKAAFVVANARGSVKGMRAYLDRRPELKERYEEWVDTGRTDAHRTLRDAFEGSPPPIPEELRGP